MDKLVLRMRGENQLLKKDHEISQEEVKVAQLLQEDTRMAIDRMALVVASSGDAIAKARLFDEGVHKEQNVSRSRMARILADFANQLEASMREFREAAQKIDESNRRLYLDHPVSLSRLSLPSQFEDSDVQEIMDGKFETPISTQKAPAQKTPAPAPPVAKAGEPSTPVPERVPEGGDKSRSLSEVSKQLTPDSDGSY